MKNQKIIQAFNQVRPNKAQKEKMLQQILEPKTKQAFHWQAIWRFGFTCLIITVFLTGSQLWKKPNLEVGVPRAYESREREIEEDLMFCYEGVCYQRVEFVAKEDTFQFLYFLFDERIDEEIKVYQSKLKNMIILNWNDFYVLYQKIEI